ncbi:hypothetical protein EDB85DRAFT_2159885 [Lactarius pseudohatsudake]|nr:hypothetical protein EDB85DRAFT_2159885 [Lactarius pseudohatsudake]
MQKKLTPQMKVQVPACPIKLSIIPPILPANDLAIGPFRPVSATSRDDGVLAQALVIRVASAAMRDVPSAASE